MNAKEYKKLISQPGVLQHKTLTSALEEIMSRQEFELAKNLQLILDHNKISKPERHQGLHDQTTFYYNIDLSESDIINVISTFHDLEASSLDKNGEATSMTPYYTNLVNEWNSLLDPYHNDHHLPAINTA